MRIAIVGLGGVGGYFGGRLTQTHHETIFIARGAHLQAIREHGLYVTSDGGDFIAHPTLATDDAGQVGVVDVVVLATKAWQVADVLPILSPLVGEQTSIVPLLNGVEPLMTLSERFGAERVLGGFCRVLSHRPRPGHISQGGTPPFIALGEQDGTPSERVETLRQLFESASITVQSPDNILGAMWQKLLFIASFGGVGAVTRHTAGVIRTLPETRTLLEEAMREVQTVAEARDIPMRPDAVTFALSQVDRLPHDGMASMQRDILNGNPSELEAQNGAVVRLGAQAGVPTPCHSFLYRSLIAQERQARGTLDAGLSGL